MFKTISIGTFLCLGSIFAMAQSPSAKTSFYLELGGNGGLYSVNIERYLFSNINGRIGVALWRGDLIFGEESILTIPIMANALFGERNSKLEVGAGLMFGRSKYKSTSFLGGEERKDTFSNLTAVVGYRYQEAEGGIFLRAGITPFLALGDNDYSYPDNGFFISGGVSVGYNF